MIRRKDVVRMRIPFPNSRSRLAQNSHMYICMEEGFNKVMVKCQTERPTHLISSNPPFRYISEEADISRNPFNNKTIIDCDKNFAIDNVEIDTSLLTTSRRDVCDDLFNKINTEITSPVCVKQVINPSHLITLNHLIRAR